MGSPWIRYADVGGILIAGPGERSRTRKTGRTSWYPNLLVPLFLSRMDPVWHGSRSSGAGSSQSRHVRGTRSSSVARYSPASQPIQPVCVH